MAFTRKMLKALGVTEEAVDQIMDAHIEVVDALKVYKESAEKLEGVQKELDELKKSGGDWQKKYEKEHSDFDAYKTAQIEKETTAKKDSLYRKLLIDNNVSEKRVDAIMKLTDLKKLNLKDDDFEEKEKIVESIKKDWADFIVTEDHGGAGTETPPDGGGSPEKHDVPLIF